MNCIKLPNFLPVCFTMVMGSGAFAIATLEMSEIWSGFYPIASLLNLLNYIVFIFLIVWFLLTWKQSLPDLHKNFETPAGCALYSTSGISLLVLGAQALRFGWSETIVFCFWVAGALLTLFLNFTIMLRFFLHPGLEIGHITPVFFIPVAGLIVVPVAGSQICAFANSVMANVASILCTLSLGGGFVLYLGHLCMMLQRHLLVAPMPDSLAPTFWIHIAPIGWGGVSLVRFAKYALGTAYEAAAQLCSLLLFGASMWWLVMAVIICCRAIGKRNLQFSLTWWSFVFPTGSLAILSRSLEFSFINELFPYIWGLLAILWLICAMTTIVYYIQRTFYKCRV